MEGRADRGVERGREGRVEGRSRVEWRGREGIFPANKEKN